MNTLAVLLSLLGLGSVATSASAECAWVLWEESREMGHASGEPPHPEASYKSIEECIKRIDEEWRKASAPPVFGRHDRSAPTTATITVRMGQRSGLITYTCLPDTVDPRGPRK